LPYGDHRVIPLFTLYDSMADTKRGRDEQARREERRQIEWEIQQARDRADEPEPPRTGALEGGELRTCHRRGCSDPAAFVVLERYLEETGHGAVEAVAYLCPVHTREEGPTNLDPDFADYLFRVDPIGETSP
jgi:hypothetical protein